MKLLDLEFIPYEQAQALRDLGFDQKTLAIWEMDDNSGEHSLTLGVNQLVVNGNIPAPLYQQAFEWFREEHNLFILMQVGQHNGEHQTFYFNVFEFGVNLYKSKFRSKTGTHTYEEAELSCLKKLIELVQTTRSSERDS